MSDPYPEDFLFVMSSRLMQFVSAFFGGNYSCSKLLNNT